MYIYILLFILLNRNKFFDNTKKIILVLLLGIYKILNSNNKSYLNLIKNNLLLVPSRLNIIYARRRIKPITNCKQIKGPCCQNCYEPGEKCKYNFECKDLSKCITFNDNRIYWITVLTGQQFR